MIQWPIFVPSSKPPWDLIVLVLPAEFCKHRECESRAFLHDDSHKSGKLQSWCTITSSKNVCNLTSWHISLWFISHDQTLLNNIFREIICLILAHVVVGKELGKLSTSQKMGAWSKVSVASTRLCSRSSCNLWIKTWDLPCCSCVETQNHRKSPKHRDDIRFSLYRHCTLTVWCHTQFCSTYMKLFVHFPAVQSSRDFDKTLILVSWSSYNLQKTAAVANFLCSTWVTISSGGQKMVVWQLTQHLQSI